MKEISLSVSRSRLYGEVARTAAYLGVKQAPADQPGEHFDRLTVIDGDKVLLDRLSNEAALALVEHIKSCVAAIDLGEEVITVSLSLSDAYDSCLTVSVTGNFEAYMAAFVTARWLRLTLPAKEEVWMAESRRFLNEIASALYHRNPPRRHT
ncbi:MAG: hypothetical protein K2J78_06000 [Muribaculaceae bacterium]|nr:hypothetical protein [Muribaculaceae bacterium]